MNKIEIHGVEINYTYQPDFWAVVGAGKWEGFTFTCIQQLYCPDGIFIDVGAWNGVFSVFAQKLGAEAYAIEPDFAAIGLLRQLYRDNELEPGRRLFEGGITAKGGIKTLSSPLWGGSESSFVDRDINIAGTREVQTMDLESFFQVNAIDPERVFLMKIDIEGAEVEVLAEAREFIELFKPPLHVSFHPQWITGGYKDIMYLFDIYDAVSDGGTMVTRSNFADVLANHEHAILFTAV